jgi:hypothetical protein
MDEKLLKKRARDARWRAAQRANNPTYLAHRAKIQKDFRVNERATEKPKAIKERRKDRKMYMRQHRSEKKKAVLTPQAHDSTSANIINPLQIAVQTPYRLRSSTWLTPMTLHTPLSAASFSPKAKSASATKRERKRLIKERDFYRHQSTNLKRTIWKLQKRMCRSAKHEKLLPGAIMYRAIVERLQSRDAHRAELMKHLHKVGTSQ